MRSCLRDLVAAYREEFLQEMIPRGTSEWREIYLEAYMNRLIDRLLRDDKESLREIFDEKEHKYLKDCLLMKENDQRRCILGRARNSPTAYALLQDRLGPFMEDAVEEDVEATLDTFDSLFPVSPERVLALLRKVEESDLAEAHSLKLNALYAKALECLRNKSRR
jgi:hypothetical protein